MKISIRTPAWGVTLVIFTMFGVWYISIRTPAWGVTRSAALQ